MTSVSISSALSRLRKSLYGRISLLYLILSLALCLACVWVTMSHFRTFMGAVNQRLDRNLAERLVPRVRAAATDTTVDGAVDRVAGRIADLRPAVQLYLLNDSGQVRATSVAPAYLQRSRISVEPIRAFIHGATAPVRADDPASREDRKVFSAARIDGLNGKEGYLYVILNGCSADAIASTFKQTYVGRTLAFSVLLALGFTTIVGLVLFWLLTRRFRSLTNTVRQFKEGDYDQRVTVGADDEIGRLGRAFNEMADTIAAQVKALRRTDEERRRLVAKVSHDLRTPLTSIRGHAERLLDAADRGGDGAVSEEGKISENGISENGAPAALRRKERIETILQNAERLDRLSDRLHELSRLDAPETDLDLASFSLVELVHDLVVKFRPTAAERGLTLRADLKSDLPSVQGDIGQVERLLSNLIENALENTPPGGEVVVRVRQRKGDLCAAVADTGIGIPAEEIPLVTQRFHQVEREEKAKPDEAGRGREGSGLGLAVAAEIAEAHGRSLEIESAEGEGTTVTFCLPETDST